MIPPASALLEVARQAARRAGEHVLAQLDRRNDTDRILRHDIKHKLDREAQDVAFAAIRTRTPQNT